MDNLLEKGLQAIRESKYIELKESFDTASLQGWYEIIKDIVALANSGGGVILIGLDNYGNVSGFNVEAILRLDPADITNKIASYTNYQFADFEILECQKESVRLVALRVHASALPIVFTKPGTFPVDGGKQKTAFSVGTVYFRHGAKSEPGTTEDLRKVLERQLELTRREWM